MQLEISKRKVKLKSIITVFVITIFFLFPWISSSFDEVIALIATIYIFSELTFSSKKISKEDLSIIILISIYFIAGLISNSISGIDRSLVLILIDYFLFIKVFVLYLGFKFFLRNIGYTEIISLLQVPAKMFTIVVFSFGLLEQFFNLGMSNGSRYGLKSFSFIYGYGGALGLVVFVAFGILLLEEKRGNKKYAVLLGITMLLTTKASVMILPITFFALYFLLKNLNRFRLWQLIPLGIFIYPFTKWSIDAYLLNDNYSARSVLYRGAFDLFKSYFPFGSGFGTYGGEMAARYYSPVYLAKGFYNYDGLEPPGILPYNYLNDNFMAMIIGQTGFIGIIILILLIITLIKSFNNNRYSFFEKVYSISVVIGVFAGAVGSSMLKSAPGCLLFIFLGIVGAKKQVKIK